MLVDFETFKILCQLNYLGFYFAYDYSSVSYYSIRIAFQSAFVILRWVFKCEEFGLQFFILIPTIRY